MFIPVEQIRTSDPFVQKTRERMYINKFQMIQKGLNINHSNPQIITEHNVVMTWQGRPITVAKFNFFKNCQLQPKFFSHFCQNLLIAALKFLYTKNFKTKKSLFQTTDYGNEFPENILEMIQK